EAEASPDGSLDVNVGFALYDVAWRDLGTFQDTKRLTPNPNPTAGLVDRFSLTISPDSYHVALHLRAGEALAHHRFDLRVPDFSGPGLALSDVVPAFAVTPAPGGGLTGRGLDVRPNPARRFAVDQN